MYFKILLEVLMFIILVSWLMSDIRVNERNKLSIIKKNI